MAEFRTQSIGSYEDNNHSNWSVFEDYDVIDTTPVETTGSSDGLSDYVTVERNESKEEVSEVNISSSSPNDEAKTTKNSTQPKSLGLHHKLISLPESNAVQKPFALNGRPTLPGAEKQREPVDIKSQVTSNRALSMGTPSSSASASSSSSFMFTGYEGDGKSQFESEAFSSSFRNAFRNSSAEPEASPEDDTFHRETKHVDDAPLPTRDRSSLKKREQWFQGSNSPEMRSSSKANETAEIDTSSPRTRSDVDQKDEREEKERKRSDGSSAKSPKLFSPLFFDGGAQAQSPMFENTAFKHNMEIKRPESPKDEEINVVMKEEAGLQSVPALPLLDESSAQSLSTGSVPPFYAPPLSQDSKPQKMTKISTDTIEKKDMKQRDAKRTDSQRSREHAKPRKKVLRTVSGNKVKRPSSFMGLRRREKENDDNMSSNILARHSSEATIKTDVKTLFSENNTSSNNKTTENEPQEQEPNNSNIEMQHIDLGKRKAWLENLVRKSQDEDSFAAVKRRSVERSKEKRERRISVPPDMHLSMNEYSMEMDVDITHGSNKDVEQEFDNRLRSPASDDSHQYPSSHAGRQRQDSQKSDISEGDLAGINEAPIVMNTEETVMSEPCEIVDDELTDTEKKGLGSSTFAARTKWLESLSKNTIDDESDTDDQDRAIVTAVRNDDRKYSETEAIEPLIAAESQPLAESVNELTEEPVDQNEDKGERLPADDNDKSDTSDEILSIQERIRRLQAGKQTDDTPPAPSNLVPLVTSSTQQQTGAFSNSSEIEPLASNIVTKEETVGQTAIGQSLEVSKSNSVSSTQTDVTKPTDQSSSNTTDDMKIYKIDRLEHTSRWEERRKSRDSTKDTPVVSSEKRMSMASLGASLLGLEDEEPIVTIESMAKDHSVPHTNGFASSPERNGHANGDSGEIDYRNYVKDNRIRREIEEQERREAEIKRRWMDAQEENASEETSVNGDVKHEENSHDNIPKIQPQADEPREDDVIPSTIVKRASLFENNNNFQKRDAIHPAAKVPRSPISPSSPVGPTVNGSSIWDPRSGDGEETIIVTKASCENSEPQITMDTTSEKTPSAQTAFKRPMTVIEREQEAERLRLLEFEEERKQRNEERMKAMEAERARQEEIETEKMLRDIQEENVRQVQLMKEKERMQNERDEKMRRQQKTQELRALFESSTSVV